MDEIVRQISDYQWFKPENVVSKAQIHRLLATHQERFKRFGLGKIATTNLMKIWPGQEARNILTIRAETRKSLIRMFSDNILGMIRELALDNGRISKLDMAVRDIETKVKNAANSSAIEAAGLTVRATVSMPVIIPGNPVVSGPNDITDFDIVEKAVEDAVEASACYVSWHIVHDLLDERNYLNPFAPLMQVFCLGLWPIGINNNQYLVFVPGGRRTLIV